MYVRMYVSANQGGVLVLTYSKRRSLSYKDLQVEIWK